MNPIRLMGKAFYSKWIESVTHCEPKFEELPECYLLQLDDCMRAAVRALGAVDLPGAALDAAFAACLDDKWCIEGSWDFEDAFEAALLVVADGEEPRFALNKVEEDAA